MCERNPRCTKDLIYQGRIKPRALGYHVKCSVCAKTFARTGKTVV